MGEMPLEAMRVQPALNYWFKLEGQNEDHPTQTTMKPCWEKERGEISIGWIIEQEGIYH